MRGIPGSNIRLSIPKGETDNETSISLTSDDFQQRTLASLGLVGSAADPGSEDETKGPTLEIAPLTVYVQTPSGRRIKLKDSLDVEAMVDTLEEMVTKELESANLLEASESSEERFRLYHDRNPMRRGNKITRYKIKHMDVLKLKFGTDEADANQKQERRKAYEKKEKDKAMRKSSSAGNLRRLQKAKTQRAVSSSPDRGATRATTPRKQRLAQRTQSPSSEGSRSNINRRGVLRKSPSNELLKRLSKSLTNIRTSSFSPIRGLARNHSCSSETQAEKQKALTPTAKRRMMKARRDSDPSVAANSPRSASSPRSRSAVSPRSRSAVSPRPRTGSSGSKPRRNVKTRTDERSSSTPRARTSSQPRTRSRSNAGKESRSKSRSTGERNPTPTKRRNRKLEDRRSRSSSKHKAREQAEERRKSARSPSSSRGREDRDARNSSKKSEHSERSRGSEKSKSKSNRSRSGVRKNSRGPRTSINDEKKPTEEKKSNRPWKRSSSAKNLPEKEAKSDSTEETKKIVETKPRRSWRRDSSSKTLPEEEAKKPAEAKPRRSWRRDSSSKTLPEEEDKKPAEENKPRRNWKRDTSAKPLSDKSDGIPDAFRISMQSVTKNPDSEKDKTGSPPSPASKKEPSPPSPVSVVSETLNMSQVIDDASQESSDIQSADTQVSVYNESTGNKSVEAKHSPKKTKAQEAKNSNTSKRMSFQQLKQAKAKEEADENAKADDDTGRSSSKSKRSLTTLSDVIGKSGNTADKAGKYAALSSDNSATFTDASENSTILQSVRSIPNVPSPRNEKSVLGTNTSPPSSCSIVDRAKAKFNKEKSTSPPWSIGSVSVKPESKSIKDTSSGETTKEVGTERTPKEGNSAVRLAKAKFEKESANPRSGEIERQERDENRAGSSSSPRGLGKPFSGGKSTSEGDSGDISRENDTAEIAHAKSKAQGTPTKRVRKRRSSAGLPEKVINELKDTLHGKDDEGKSPAEAQKHMVEKQTRKVESAKENTVEAKGNSIEHRAKSFGTTIRPLRPSMKDTQRRYSDDGATVAMAATEAVAKLEASVVDEMKEEEKTSKTSSTSEKPNVETVKEETARKPLQPSSRDSTPYYSPETAKSSIKDRIGKFQNGNPTAKSPGSIKDRIGKSGGKDNSDSKSVGLIKDRIGKFQTGGKENTNTQPPEPIKGRVGKLKPVGQVNPKSPDSAKGRKGKIQTDGKENEAAKPRGSIKDRIGKFGGSNNTNPSGFQMIGLATLGLKNTVTSKNEKKDDIDKSNSTTYSFFCSNDELSEYESSDFSDSDSESSDTDGEFESIHVIGPDLTPIEIPLDSDSETLGNIKGVVAEAAGIPINELRLGLQNEASDLDESLRTNLDDNFKLSPGDILAVQPSTVVVKLPDGRSKLELSVFPGTLLSDIKDYIAQSTGTTPSRQLLFNFEKNFDEELEDDEPISTDCTLRLTVY